MLVTLAGLYLVMIVYGTGDLRAGRDRPAPATRAAETAGADPILAPPALSPPSAEIIEAATQTPERVQQFPGPPLRPSPEHASRRAEETQQAPAGAQGPILYVTGSSVNFRAGPSTSDRVIGALGEGAPVEALGPTDADWVNIRDSEGRVGYMSGRFLSPAQP